VNEVLKQEGVMKIRYGSLMLAAVILTALFQQAFASDRKAKEPVLLGTTGPCNNAGPGGQCLTKSTLVQLDPETGALSREIGPVGFTVNGLAWDETSGRLYATTPPGDQNFHGLITINLRTGKGTPVNKHVDNFGLAGERSPVHSITIDVFGNMAGWYEKFGGPGVTDAYVRIDRRTGVATEFSNTGINTSQNGLAFGEFNLLWNIDSPRVQTDGEIGQTAYLIDTFDGKPLLSLPLFPPAPAAQGDFKPGTNLYYGLTFDTADPFPGRPTFIVVFDPRMGSVTQLGQTVDDLHTITFIKDKAHKPFHFH
jgi:hypothetical protein